jgi:hypothetical protein
MKPGCRDAIIFAQYLFMPMPRRYYYSMQIFSELGFVAKKANMTYFSLFFSQSSEIFSLF